MMELLSLPHHGHATKTIRRLKSRSQQSYQYVSQRGDWVCLYGSDSEGVARNEWWLDVLTARGLLHEQEAGEHGVSEQSVTIIENIGDLWHATLIDAGVVRQIWTDTHYHLCAANAGTSHIFLVESSPAESVDENHERIAPPSDQELGSLELYRLTSPAQPLNNRRVIIGVSVLLAAVIALTLYVQRSDSNEPATSQVSHESVSPELKALPPWGMYRLVLHETVSAQTVMEGVLLGATHLALLPPGWKAKGFIQQGAELTATIEREPNGLIGVWQQWQRQHDSLSPFLSSDGDQHTLRLPLASGLPYWQSHVMPMQPTDQRLQDSLVTMGFIAQQSSDKSSSTWQSKTWEVTHQGVSASELNSLAALFAVMPVSMKALTLTPVSPHRWSLSFSITLYGGL
ncbi:Pilin accessory protein (PilO) [Vibrio crassostreae]|uniref:hypothetical protein n=1 Tax=Vibrio crassostreae TaxID=246167 RepID=UPI0005DC0729|nr:hypothetical protein [Vibrio crassostreae]CAK1764698.1 Pilin accessory protein (PilO) [Vibrio crassostreae]CAK1795162.1 Pilin accessory protein (PilO) [Vibrio crassostreae]CAK1799085.1 Pilin accessory protein (PilO) [Vibrio crassostreae]CAK2591941.1 Pilin accessory protein (PilO) [Vibrio crassostreae]CAK2715607.1 Pilin accessory protein (PilO) [Vibrio crassostreae]